MRERSLLDYWVILSRRRWSIYLVVATSVASALIVGALIDPVYEARAALYLPDKLPEISYLSPNSTSSLVRQSGTPVKDEDSYKPYVGILKSTQLAERVAAQFPRKKVIKLLRSDVDFEVTDEMIVRVYSRDADPVLAADVANAYVDGLNAILAENSQQQVLDQPRYIGKAMGDVERDLRAAESALKRFEEKNRIASLDTELTALSNQKADFQAKVEDTMVGIAANESKQQALLEDFRREGEDVAASEVAVTSPVIEHLRVELADLVAKLAETEAELGKRNMEVTLLHRRKEELESQLVAEVKRWAGSRIKPQSTRLEALRNQLADLVVEASRLQASAKGYGTALTRIDARIRRYPEIRTRWSNLNDVVSHLRTYRQQLTAGLTEARLQNDRQMRLIVPLDHAQPPLRPAFPIWWLNTIVALFAGLLAGLGYAFFLDYLDETREVRTGRLVKAILARRGQS